MSFLQLAPELLGLDTIENYIEDDWEDNSLTNRTSPEDGPYAHSNANEAGDVLIGRYRPVWNTVNISNTVVQNNRVEMTVPTNSNGGIYNSFTTTSEFTTGSWSVDLQLDQTESGTGSHIFFYGLMTDGSRALSSGNSICIQSSTESDVGLRKIESGSPTYIISMTSTNTSLTNQLTFTVARDSYGNYELLEDGSSRGTTTDSFVPPLVEQSIMTYQSNQSEPPEVTFYVDNLAVK